MSDLVVGWILGVIVGVDVAKTLLREIQIRIGVFELWISNLMNALKARFIDLCFIDLKERNERKKYGIEGG